jgi:MFS family permease
MGTYALPFALSLGDSDVGGLFVGYTLTAVVVRLALGNLADRFGRRFLSIVALSLYGIVVLLTADLEAGGLFTLGLGLGLAHGFLYPALNALAIEDAPAQSRGMVMTTFNGAFNLGFALSVLGLGLLADHAGYPPVFLVAGALTLSGVTTLLFLPSARVGVRGIS